MHLFKLLYHTMAFIKNSTLVSGLSVMLIAFGGNTMTVGQESVDLSELKSIVSECKLYAGEQQKHKLYIDESGGSKTINFQLKTRGCIIIQVETSHEYGSEFTSYIYKDNSLIYISFTSDLMLDHWNADTVRFQQIQREFFLWNESILLGQEKSYLGIQSIDQGSNLKETPWQLLDSIPDEFLQNSRRLISLKEQIESVSEAQ